MKFSEGKKLLGCLEYLNTNYGRGSVIGVRMDEDDKGGWFTCQLTHGTVAARFSIENGIVYARGHQRKLDKGR
jgi:hypothetical protein